MHEYIRRGQHGLRACRGRAANPQNPFSPSIRGGFPSPYPSHPLGPANFLPAWKYLSPLKTLKNHWFYNVFAHGRPKVPPRTPQGPPRAPQGALRDAPEPPKAPQSSPQGSKMRSKALPRTSECSKPLKNQWFFNVFIIPPIAS